MQISYDGIKFIEDLEGYRDKAYLDTGGVWTIGFGTIRIDGAPVQPGQTCTRQQAEEWMRADLAPAQTTVNQSVKVPLRQNQFDALVSFVYNVGSTAFRGSTMCLKLNMRDFAGAAKEFDKWIYDNKKIIPGLVARRKIERSKFES